MNRLPVLPMILILAVALSAHAGSDRMQPGLWEYTMKMEMPSMPKGMPFAMAPIKTTACVTQADVDKGSFAKDPNQKSECEIRNFRQGGGVLSYDSICPGKPPTNGHCEYAVTATTLQGPCTMVSGETTVKQTLIGKRLGNCK